MKVSIIIPVYNVEKYLSRCVESAAVQTCKDLEIILVDDGSTDSSPMLCDQWAEKDSRVRVIHQRNSGPGVARDAGTQAAMGEFVSYMDSDDWLEPNAIELLVAEQERTDADVVWGKMLMHKSDGDVELCEPHYINKHEWILCYSRLTTGIVMTCCRRLIRRSLLVDNNIHAVEGCNYAEDKVQMTQIAYYANSFSYIDDIVYHYNRLNEDSLTAQGRKQYFNMKVFQEEMGSISWIEHFYEDKEKEYHDEVVKAKLLLLKNWLESAIELKSPQGYRAAKGMISKSNPTFLSVIEMDGLKNKIIYSSYFTIKAYHWIAPKVYRLIHAI